MTENNEYLQLKNMNDNELKEWQTQSVKHKVAMVLIMDGVSFSYTEEDGIVFTAPECYVARLIRPTKIAMAVKIWIIFTKAISRL